MSSQGVASGSAIVRLDGEPDVEVRPVDLEMRDVAGVLEGTDRGRIELERVRQLLCLRRVERPR